MAKRLRDRISEVMMQVSRGEEIGEGSSRVAYDSLLDLTCIKFAKDWRGVAQNEAEVVLYEKMNKRERLRYAKIINHHPDFLWVEMEKLEKVTKCEAKLFHKFEERIEVVDEKYGYMNASDIGMHDYPTNCGVNSRGTIMLYDYGFSDEVAELY